MTSGFPQMLKLLWLKAPFLPAGRQALEKTPDSFIPTPQNRGL
jgi:hypothetical protein